jgi:GTP-binding protein
MYQLGKLYSLINEKSREDWEKVYCVSDMLADINEAPTVFEPEFNPDVDIVTGNEPYSVEYNEKDNEYVVEGPRIEKMLGYTNLDSERGFQFFQKFLKENGILDELEALGIQEGDTVRMYGLAFNYYKE